MLCKTGNKGRGNDKKNFDPFKVNKESLTSDFGKIREKFCLDQQEQLKDINEKIYQGQLEEANSEAKRFPATVGCTMCCPAVDNLFTQECEAIVHYLYNHKSKMSSFIRNYND